MGAVQAMNLEVPLEKL